MTAFRKNTLIQHMNTHIHFLDIWIFSSKTKNLKISEPQFCSDFDEESRESCSKSVQVIFQNSIRNVNQNCRSTPSENLIKCEGWNDPFGHSDIKAYILSHFSTKLSSEMRISVSLLAFNLIVQRDIEPIPSYA